MVMGWQRNALVSWAVIFLSGSLFTQPIFGAYELPWLFDYYDKPTDWLQLGGDFRFREVYAENHTTVDETGTENHWHFQRYRTRLWQKFTPTDSITVNSRFLWEFRTWGDPPAQSGATDFDEVLIDQLNVQLDFGPVLNIPLSAVIGRQDMDLNAWLIHDGTPIDASRTRFLDGARLTLDVERYQSSIDVAYIDMAAFEDRWLHPIDEEQDRMFTHQNEYGAILYVTNRAFEPTQWEGFFIFRNDNAVTALSRQAELYTFGGAIQGSIDGVPDAQPHWLYRAEGAFQTGHRKDLGQHIKAYGANTCLTFAWNDLFDNQIHIGYEIASGDDPDSEHYEQFDLLWGQYPRWSDLYAYTYQMEGEFAENSNLHRLNIGHSVTPWTDQAERKLRIATDYNLLWCHEDPQGPDNIDNQGHFRGHLLRCLFDFQIHPKIGGHVVGEYLWPGEVYQRKDEAMFLRFNLEVLF